MRDLEYPDRLKKLGLPTLAYRRVWGDMIETYKMLHGVYDREVADVLTLHKESAGTDLICTRGHSLKLLKPRLIRTLRQHSFAHRIVALWNDLPEEVVTAPTLNTFKNRLDRHWSDQDVLYDYKAAITGSRRGSGHHEELTIEAKLAVRRGPKYT